MIRFLSVLTVVLVAFSSDQAMAHDVYVTEISRPHEVIKIFGDISSSQSHLGELNKYPVMYEFVVAEQVELNVVLRQKYSSEVLRAGLEIKIK
jgi:hypothetical protein